MFHRADNEHGFIQCTIKPEQKKEFEKLGFVEDIMYLPEKKTKKRKNKE